MIAKIYPNGHAELNGKQHPVRYFDIRKLTERECLRLMDVSEKDIDTLTSCPKLTRSALYKMAGNSIVVSCLYHIFKNIYCGSKSEPSLFDEPTFKVSPPPTIRMVTLCSGYDSQVMAMQRLARELNRNVDLTWWAEFDPDSNKPQEEQPAVIAHNALFPQWSERNLGDMTKIDWNSVECDEEIDMLTYSTPCFVSGTLIQTKRGLVPIETINTEDEVITHTRQWHKVKELMLHRYLGEMIKIRTMMTEEILCTSNHPFYVRKRYRKDNKRFFDKPIWLESKYITKDYYLGYPINQTEKYPEWNGVVNNRWGHHKISNKLSPYFPSKDFWYLIGRYIGDGWKRKSKCGNSVIICYSNRNKDSLFSTLETLGIHYNVEECRTANKIHIYSNELFKFVERYGYYAHGKRIDRETLDLPKHLLKSFLDGYLDSDGCMDGQYHKITTVSKELAYNIMECVSKVYNSPTRLYYTKRPPQTTIEGRLVNQRDTYSVLWKTKPNKQDKAFYDNGYIWYPIREIKSYLDDVLVYNMEVDIEHSYVANNAIVHNCQSVSQAGRREGIAKGSGTRSSILWYTENAIRALKPKFLLQENVKALCNKVNAPHFNQWQKVCNDLGYDNYWAVLNAKDYGVPQNRERVFMLSVRRDLGLPTYHFPKPFPLQSKIADVLEDVSEQIYFLNPTNVIKFLQMNETDKAAHIVYAQTDHKLTDEEINFYRNGQREDT